MVSIWDAWVEKIIEDRASSNPSTRTRGFILQLSTELAIYALVGSLITGFAYGFGAITEFTIISNPMVEVPAIIGGTTVVLFSQAWDDWLREQEETTAVADVEGETQESEDEETVQATLDDDTATRR